MAAADAAILLPANTPISAPAVLLVPIHSMPPIPIMILAADALPDNIVRVAVARLAQLPVPPAVEGRLAIAVLR